MAEVPQFPLDFQILPDGSMPLVEQGSPEDVANNIAVSYMTTPETRDAWPTFGVDAGLFSQVSADPQRLAAEIADWEPQAGSLLDVRPDLYDEAVLRITAFIAQNTGEQA